MTISPAGAGLFFWWILSPGLPGESVVNLMANDTGDSGPGPAQVDPPGSFPGWLWPTRPSRRAGPPPKTNLAAGLFFRSRPRSHTGMDPDLENVIRQALADAEAAGKDYQGQTEEAVRAVQRARGDMTASDALVAVNLVRRS